MRKRNSKTIKLAMVGLSLLLSLTFIGCRKQVDRLQSPNQTRVVSLDEIKQWASTVIPKLKDQPALVYDLSEKMVFKNQIYVRVPVKNEQGHFYFTKTPEGLQSLYVVTQQPDKSKLDGAVGFVDIEKQEFTIAIYKNDKPVALFGIKDAKSFFSDAFLSGASSGKIKTNGSCAEAMSVIKLKNGRDSVIVKTITNGDIPCPGQKTIWQAIWESISNFFGAIGSTIGDAFNFLFGWIGGSGGGGSYTGGGSFGTGGYGGWSFGGFVGGGYTGGGYSGGGYTGGGYDGGGGPQWGAYDPSFQVNVDAYAQSLGYYWEDPSYDVNSTTFPPYDPAVDGPYDSQGYRKNGPPYQYVGGVVQNYTNDNGGKYVIFTSTNGTQTTFPGATITDYLVLPGAGVTTANGGIHMSRTNNGLSALQHEYGHYLQAQQLGTFYYYKRIVPASLYSAATDPAYHNYFWTEIDANQRATAFFGPNSAISQDLNFPK